MYGRMHTGYTSEKKTASYCVTCWWLFVEVQHRMQEVWVVSIGWFPCGTIGTKSVLSENRNLSSVYHLTFNDFGASFGFVKLWFTIRVLPHTTKTSPLTQSWFLHTHIAVYISSSLFSSVLIDQLCADCVANGRVVAYWGVGGEGVIVLYISLPDT